MPERAGRIPLLACGIFAREFRLLEPSLREAFEPSFLDSMLHMRPERLDRELAALLEAAGEGPRVILYGDCCPHMEELGGLPRTARCAGENCIEAALGRERYRGLRRRGAFFFMPEWLSRWEEIFAGQLGLGNPELAGAFMREHAKLLVYVDTGAIPVPEAELARIGAFFGLPTAVERPGLGPLSATLALALDRVRSGEGGAS